jgi:3-isopropylmalate/(R)-2-methylmalate dehydratase large subunit
MDPRTLSEKIWESHVVRREAGQPDLLYVDLHLVHEVTSAQAFEALRMADRKVRRPDLTLATVDHNVPTADRDKPWPDPLSIQQVEVLNTNAAQFDLTYFDVNDMRQGIVHVIGPEQGFTQPGLTIVCGDSHTSTHGAFGALAFGIGTSEVEGVLATQCLLQEKPLPVEVRFDGRLRHGVTAKDLVLALIAQIGTDGGTGCVFEYTGEAIRSLDMEGRMTICNMSIEAGARAGMIAPDEITFEYLERTPLAPKGAAFDEAMERWRELRSDEGAKYARTIRVDASAVAPMVTYGTNPGMAIPIDGRIPSPQEAGDAERVLRALRYMDLAPGQQIEGQPIDVVFVGSCTNSRLSDLRSAAEVMRGKRVATGVRMLVVPGSARVKADAEAEGLDRIFVESGAEWRSPGCSMCIAMNDDRLKPGQYAVSTSNRNFEGRQGAGGRTFLASPATAAASAISGRITDPRKLMGGAS